MVDKELELLHALYAERSKQSERLAQMSEAVAEISSLLTPEESLKHEEFAGRLGEYGQRTLTGQIEFQRLWTEATTAKERLEAVAQAAASIERDIEDLRALIGELRDILRAHESKGVKD
jgi:hypothetical protein